VSAASTVSTVGTVGTAVVVADDPIAVAIAEGTIGERLWFYANYHCNLECTYCLTESGPGVERRVLDADTMLDVARQAVGLGFRSIGVTGGEPFMLASMPDTVLALSEILPVLVLSNATLFSGPRLERVAAFAGLPIQIQVSLDAPEAEANDTKRGADNWVTVTEAVPELVARGVGVRIATTSSDLAADDLERLCALHRSWGVPDSEHVVRPIVSRGRAQLDQIGVVPSGIADLPAELTLTADGAFWSPFGPTVRNGRLDTDLLITRQIDPLRVPATAMVGIAKGRPRGTDAQLGIR
jgi:sulfatase maturation enzyme AslB (radical SAM superfamily)